MFRDFNLNLKKCLKKDSENTNKQLNEIMKEFQDNKEK